ncbi:MAG: isoleucyl-tRNA synthetase [Pedobacter sp.]|nr:MAG: isoleucyl-tRNA synthetase [Pedobacter sp.]
MVRILKLQKAVYIIILGILTLIAAHVMSENKVDGSNFVMGASGALFMIGSLMFLYPILFAKKTDTEGDKVELQPLTKEPIEDVS